MIGGLNGVSWESARNKTIGDNSIRLFFVVDGMEILLGEIAGKYHALVDRWTHRGGSLSEGTLEGGIITCPRHSGQFDIKTDEVRGAPPDEPLKGYGLLDEGWTS